MKKKLIIKLNKKADRLFHQEHRSGSGEHDSRPKRQRTRGKNAEQWKKDEGCDQL